MIELDPGSNSDDPILASLSIPCADRTNLDLVPIIDFVQGLKIFSSFSSHPETVIQIASKLELQEFYNGSYIFQEGSVGSHFYIILDGEVSIVKKKRILALVDITTETLVLVKLGCGQYFGENALQSKEGLRTASALATKRTKLLVLHVEDYQSILSVYKNTLKIQVRKAISSNDSIFRHWDPAILDELGSYAIVRSFSINQEIIRVGDRINSFMIIKSGIVKIIKAVSRSSVHNSYRTAVAKVKKNTSLGAEKANLLPTKHTSGTSSPMENRQPANQFTNGGFLMTDNDKRSSSYRSSANSHQRQYSQSSRDDSVSANHPHHADTPPGYWLLSGHEDEANRVEKAIDLGIEGDERNVARESVKHSHDTAHVSKPSNGLYSTPADRANPPNMLEFTVAVLLSGSVIGELSVIDPEQLSPCGVVSSTAVEVYCFDSEALIRLGIRDNRRIMDVLRDDWKFRNPPLEEIRKHLQHKYEQEAYKRKALLVLPKIGRR